jgi:hypothetical protein
LEKADVFKRLRAYGWTPTRSPTKTGLSEVRVIQLVETCRRSRRTQGHDSQGRDRADTGVGIAKEQDFDTERTIAALPQRKSASQGRKRVTARHVKGTKTSLRKSLADVLSGCTVEDMGEDGFVVVFSREQFAELQALAKCDMKVISAFTPLRHPYIPVGGLASLFGTNEATERDASRIAG